MSIVRRLRDVPIRRKLVALMLLTAGISLLLVAPAWIFVTWTSAKSAAIHNLETTAQVIAANSTAAMAFGDTRAATEILSALHAKPEVTMACLYHIETGSTALFANYSPLSEACAAVPADTANAGAYDTLRSEQAIILSNERIGTLVVMQNLQDLYTMLKKQLAIIFLVIAGIFSLSFFIALRMQGAITAPILKLADMAKRISESKDYSLRVTVDGQDELGQLSADFNHMLQQISSADAAIKAARSALTVEVEKKTAANLELEHALDNLRTTQTQLVQSEKMASLGTLVAGVAHEINTPIGIGVTAASTLQARAAQIKQQYETAELKRTDLERFLRMANDSGDIILNNLQRAAELIQSFKRVAVDQSSNERRTFKLKEYIGEVLQSLTPKYKNLGHSIRVSCPDDLELDGYPGVLAQILTNFVSNSLIHAFDPDQQGHIDLEVELHGEEIMLRCRDDGKGVAAAELPRIFDPFYTTKRGSGGTGLGLHIVYNLVTKTLGGTITAENAPGHGLAITARFPRIVKEDV